ncbi:MAG: hypothetical protein ACPGNP_05420 [Acidimicrobiales bacterium]
MLDLYEVSIWPWIIANAVVAIWALFAHLEERLRHRSLWYAVGVAQAVIAAHVVFAVAAQAQDAIEPGEPLLYGLVAFMSCGMIFSYRSYMQDRPYLLYGLGSLWLMGLGIRAAYLVLWFPA